MSLSVWSQLVEETRADRLLGHLGWRHIDIDYIDDLDIDNQRFGGEPMPSPARHMAGLGEDVWLCHLFLGRPSFQPSELAKGHFRRSSLRLTAHVLHPHPQLTRRAFSKAKSGCC